MVAEANHWRAVVTVAVLVTRALTVALAGGGRIFAALFRGARIGEAHGRKGWAGTIAIGLARRAIAPLFVTLRARFAYRAGFMRRTCLARGPLCGGLGVRRLHIGGGRGASFCHARAFSPA